MIRILIVEDEIITARIINKMVESFGYTVIDISDNGLDAVQKVKELHPDIVLMDISLKGEMDGIEASKKIRAEFFIPIIYITSYTDNKTLQRAKKTQPYGYITKPIDIHTLNSVIEMTIYKSQIDRKLWENEKRIETLLQTIQSGVIIIEADTNLIEDINRTAVKFFGLPRKKIIGKNCRDIICHSEIKNCPLSSYNKKNATMEYEIVKPNSKRVTVLITTSFFNFNKKNYLVHNFIDISERKQTEKMLLESEKKFKSIVNNLGEGLSIIDSQANLIFVNPQAHKIFGVPGGKLVGKNLKEFVVGDVFIDSQYQKKMKKKWSKSNYEAEIIRPDGARRQLLVTSTPITNHEGEYIGAYRIFSDITKRKQAEEKYRVLFENSLDAILILTSPNWFISSCNIAALKMLGSNSEVKLQSKSLWDFSPKTQSDGSLSSEKAQKMVDIALQKGSSYFEWNFKRTTGEEYVTSILLIQMTIGGEPRLQAIARDITEQRRIEMDLNHSRKLEAVGQLAAGIAHEINTPAQYVGDNTRFLKESFNKIKTVYTQFQDFFTAYKNGKIEEGIVQELEQVITNTDVQYLIDEIPLAIDQTLDGINRITHIVKAMKEFSHPGSKVKTPIDINKAIETTITVTRNEWKYLAEMETNFSPDLPPVPCLPDEFNQVILNLITNAAHAIGDVVSKNNGEKGLIHISTILNKEDVQVRIRDTGTGIPKAIRNLVFDPFFTTKETGKGTGQGLAISYNVIVMKHKGSLSFETEEGKGTTFIISLPVKPHD